MAVQRQPLTTAQGWQITVAFGIGASLAGLRVFAQSPFADGWNDATLVMLALIVRDVCMGHPRRIVAEHQAVPVAVMFEVIVNARLCAQTLKQLQIGFAVLRAEGAGRVVAVQLVTSLQADDAMFAQHLFDDLRHAAATENALAQTQVKAVEPRPETYSAQTQAMAVLVLDKAVQLPVHTLVGRAETQKRRAVQQAGEIQMRIVDHHIDLEGEGFAERFPSGKGENFEGVGQARYIETKRRLVDWIEHGRISTGGAAGDSRREAWPSREAKYNLGNDLREKQTR